MSLLFKTQTPSCGVIALVSILSLVCPVMSSNPDYTNLLNDLFGDYIKEVRPARVHRHSTMTFLTMWLTAIDDLDEKNQIFVASTILGIGYFDEYLSWTPADYGGIDRLVYPQKHVWLPDLIVENSVEKMGQLGHDDLLVVIKNNGLLTWRPKEVLKTTCNIDVSYYPFDTQTCSIILSTWSSTTADIMLRVDVFNEVQLENYQESGAWELVSTRIENLGTNSSDNRISFNFTIKRRKAYYVLNIIVPVIALCATASLVFSLPADSGEKVGMSITVLLAYAVYLTIISENMPRTSLQISIMSVYLSILLGATALAVVFTVIVLRIHHGDDEQPPGRKWRRFTVKIRPMIGLRDLGGASGEESRDREIGDFVTPVSDLKKQVRQDTEKKNKIASMFVTHHGNKVGPEDIQDHPETEATPEILWRHVSETFDRLLFIIFTTFTAVCSIGFLCLLAHGSS